MVMLSVKDTFREDKLTIANYYAIFAPVFKKECNLNFKPQTKDRKQGPDS
tara:strand:- start:6674 stop:6823 length:150 start_codon:yes stop_codon:yes gene_type:complete